MWTRSATFPLFSNRTKNQSILGLFLPSQSVSAVSVGCVREWSRPRPNPPSPEVKMLTPKRHLHHPTLSPAASGSQLLSKLFLPPASSSCCMGSIAGGLIPRIGGRWTDLRKMERSDGDGEVAQGKSCNSCSLPSPHRG